MNLFELAGKLTLDSSEYSRGLDSAVGKFKSASGSIAQIGGTIAKAGTAAIGAAAAGVVAFGKQAVEEAANYETSFAQLQTIMDSTAVSTDKMSAGLMEMSSRMGVSASELAETTYNAISATGDTAGALSIVENATKLATAGFTDTASSLSVLTTAMNSYKMSADETAGISDSLIAVQNLGVTTVAELSSSMGKAIASASAYSVDLYNLESAYVSLTKSGINTAESTTYISSMMKELGSDSTAVAKLIKSKTGKSFADLMKDGKSLGDVLGVLNEAVDGDANALMNLWSSAEAGKASNAILSQGLEQFNDNLVAIKDSAGLTDSAYDKMTSTLQHKTKLLKTNFENLKIAFGSSLIPGVGEFVDMLTGGVSSITTAVQAGDWNGVSEALGGTIGDAISLGVQKIPDVLSLATTLLRSIGGGLATASGTLAEYAPQVLRGFFGSFGNGNEFSNTAREILHNLATAITGSLDVLTNEAPIVISGFLEGLTDDATDFGSKAVQIVSKLSSAIGANAATILPAATDVILAFIMGLLGVQPDGTSLSKGGEDLVVGLATGISESAEKIADAVPDLLTALGNALVEGIPSLLGTVFGSVVGLLSKLAVDAVDALLDLIPAGFDWLLGIDRPKQSKEPGVFSKFNAAGNKALQPYYKDMFETISGQGFDGTYPQWIEDLYQAPIENNQGGRKRVVDETASATEAINKGFTDLTIVTDENTDAVKNNVNANTALGDAVTAGANAAGTAGQKYGNYTQSLAESTTAVTNSGTAAGNAAEKVGALGDNAQQAASKASATDAKFGALGNTVTATASQVTTASESVQQAGQNIQAAGESVGTATTGFDAVLEGMQKIQDATNKLPVSFGQMWMVIKNVFQNAPSFFSSLGSQIAINFMTAPSTLPGKMSQVWAQIKTAFRVGDAAQWGQDLAENFAAGIDRGFDAVTKAIDRITAYIANNLQHSTPKQGPLAGDDMWSVDMMDNWINGISGKERELHDQVKSTFDFRDAMTAPEAMTYSATGTAGQADSKIDAILDAIHDVADALRNQTIEMDGEKVADLIDSRLGSKAALAARV